MKALFQSEEKRIVSLTNGFDTVAVILEEKAIYLPHAI
jgi:hypothetical protein